MTINDLAEIIVGVVERYETSSGASVSEVIVLDDRDGTDTWEVTIQADHGKSNHVVLRHR